MWRSKEQDSELTSEFYGLQLEQPFFPLVQQKKHEEVKDDELV